MNQLDAENQSAILHLLSRVGPLSRSEIAPMLGISAPTATTQVRRLLDAGFLTEMHPTPSNGGRPKKPLKIDDAAAYTIGIDIGVDESTLVLSSLSGKILKESRCHYSSLDEMPSTIAVAVSSLESDLPPGINCLGGAASVSGTITPNAKDVSLSVVHHRANWPLARLLSLATGHSFVLVNDVQNFALWNLSFEPTRPQSFLLVSLDIGVGAAIVHDNRLLHGEKSTSTEFGHVSVDPSGPPCSCGNSGCLQVFAGVESFIQLLSHTTSHPLDSMQDARDFLDSQPRVALEKVEKVGSLIGRSVGATCTLLGLSEVLIGGKLTQVWPYLESGFTSQLTSNTSTLQQVPTVRHVDLCSLNLARAASDYALVRHFSETKSDSI